LHLHPLQRATIPLKHAEIFNFLNLWNFFFNPQNKPTWR